MHVSALYRPARGIHHTADFSNAYPLSTSPSFTQVDKERLVLPKPELPAFEPPALKVEAPKLEGFKPPPALEVWHRTILSSGRLGLC